MINCINCQEERFDPNPSLAGNLLMRFEYADGRMPVAVTKGGSTYYLTYNQVGSLRLVADISGNVVKLIDYDSFGSKYSVCAFLSQFFNKTLNFLRRGYTQISLMGTLIFPGGPSFPRPLVCPTLIQLAAL